MTTSPITAASGILYVGDADGSWREVGGVVNFADLGFAAEEHVETEGLREVRTTSSYTVEATMEWDESDQRSIALLFTGIAVNGLALARFIEAERDRGREYVRLLAWQAREDLDLPVEGPDEAAWRWRLRRQRAFDAAATAVETLRENLMEGLRPLIAMSQALAQHDAEVASAPLYASVCEHFDVPLSEPGAEPEQ